MRDVHTESPPIEMIRSGLARLAVIEAGQGDAIVCVHAGVADRRMWLPQLRDFQDAYRVIAFDQRGYGQSAYSPEPFSRAADVIAVMDALDIDTTVLIGCSIGGRAAIDIALAHPDRVKALVLVATAVSGAPQPTSFPESIRARLDALDLAESGGDLDAMNELEAQVWLDGPAAPAGRVSGPLRELFLDMNSIALHAQSPGDETPAPSAWHRLAELRMPTLVIWGPLDFPHLIGRMQEVVRAVANARGEVIAGTAHLPSLERPAEFNALVRNYLREIGLAPGQAK